MADHRYVAVPLPAEDAGQLERLERYVTRPPLAVDSIRRANHGMLEISTPPDPCTGSTVRLLDPLDWIHAVTAHIPDRGRHCVKYYGALSNRARSRALRNAVARQNAEAQQANGEASKFSKERRASWARLFLKIFEVDPLLARAPPR